MRIFFWEMVCLAFIEFVNAIYLIEGIWYSEYFSNITLSFDMWSIPLAMMFVLEILSPGWIRRPRALILMTPSVLSTFLYIFFLDNIFFYASVIYAHLLGIVVIVTVFSISSKYDNYIKKNFSYTKNLSLYWLRWVFAPLYLTFLVWTILVWEQTWLSDAFFYFFYAVTWMIIYRYAINHDIVEVPNFLNPFAKEENDEVEPDLEQNKSSNYFQFAEKLDLCMGKKELYLNPQLTIVELANCIGTNRTYLSDYLNRQLNTNFYEYVNAFRIKKACSMLVSDNIDNLEILAEACGFNSLSTFRRSFIKETGKTPLQFKKDQN
jgi:AraC-like DNA-binding protein